MLQSNHTLHSDATKSTTSTSATTSATESTSVSQSGTKTHLQSRPRSFSSASTKKYKRYQPRFLLKNEESIIPLLPSLSSTAQLLPNQSRSVYCIPTIDSFRLKTIFNETLDEEVTQTIDDLLNVSTRYKDDLRQEVKMQLSSEQRLQLKNIAVCKLTKQLNHSLHSRMKKLQKLDDSEGRLEINDLLNKSLGVSYRIKEVLKRIEKIENKGSLQGEGNKQTTANEGAVISKITKNKYPLLYLFLNKENTELSNKGHDQANDINSGHDMEETDEMQVYMHGEQRRPSPEAEDPQKPQKSQKPQDPQDPQDPQKPQKPQDPSLVPSTTIDKSDTEAPLIFIYQEELSLSPDQYNVETFERNIPSCFQYTTDSVGSALPEENLSIEDFMISTVSKFRKFKAQKGNVDGNNNYIKQDNISNLTSAKGAKSSPTTIGLRRQSLNNPLNLLLKHVPKSNEAIETHNFAQKSFATAVESEISSNYKKFRINGDILNTEYFRKQQEKLESATHPKLSNPTLNHETSDSMMSNGEERKVHGINELDTDTLSSPGFGLGSDSDSNSEMEEDTMIRSMLEAKKKKATRIQSPTPKHKPSHHCLQPTKSILKTKQDPVLAKKLRKCLDEEEQVQKQEHKKDKKLKQQEQQEQQEQHRKAREQDSNQQRVLVEFIDNDRIDFDVGSNATVQPLKVTNSRNTESWTDNEDRESRISKGDSILFGQWGTTHAPTDNKVSRFTVQGAIFEDDIDSVAILKKKLGAEK